MSTPDQPVISGATLNHLIGEAEACRDRAKHLSGARWTSTVTSADHRAAEGHERLAGELDRLRAIAELMNANAWFANFVRVQLDPRAAARHKAAAEIQEITLGAESTYQQRHGEEPTEDEFDPKRDGEVRDYEAWLEREQGAGRLLDTCGDLDEVPSHLQPDSSSDLAAEDEYLAAGTGPLAGDDRGSDS